MVRSQKLAHIASFKKNKKQKQKKKKNEKPTFAFWYAYIPFPANTSTFLTAKQIVVCNA